MTYNILVSRPLKCTHAGGQLLFIMLLHNIVLYIKPANLTARAWPFSIDFNDNNLVGGIKKMHAGGGRETIILQVMALPT